MARINWIRSLYLLIPVVLVLFQLYHVHDCPHQPFGEPKVSGRVRGGVGQQDDSPLISVIIPVGPSKHKRQEAVLQAIYSAANQTYPNVEVIVVDVSGQNNIQAALTEKTRHPIKVLAITQPNGVYAGYVRNYGIQASKGDYLAFLDADDAFLPRKLELHMQYARALDVSDFSSTEAYYAKECRFQEGGVVAPWKLEQEDAIHNPETFPLYNAEKFKPVLARKAKKNQMLRDGANLPALWDLELMNWHNCAITSSVILSKSLCELVGGFDDSAAAGNEDYGLWLRVLRQNTTRRMGYFPKALTVYDGACHGKDEQPKSQ